MNDIKKILEKYINNKDNVFFQSIFIRITGKTAKSSAKGTILLPEEICTNNTKKVRDWVIFSVAIPKTQILEYIKEKQIEESIKEKEIMELLEK